MKLAATGHTMKLATTEDTGDTEDQELNGTDLRVLLSSVAESFKGLR